MSQRIKYTLDWQYNSTHLTHLHRTSFLFHPSNVHPIILLSISMMEFGDGLNGNGNDRCVFVQCIVWCELIPLPLPLPSSSPHQNYQQYTVITLAHPLENLYIEFETEIGIETWKPGNQTNFSSWNLVCLLLNPNQNNNEMPKIKVLSPPFHDIRCVRVRVHIDAARFHIWWRWWNHNSSGNLWLYEFQFHQRLCWNRVVLCADA